MIYLIEDKRESGEGRSYTVMWRKYKRRVLLAMSSQAFAQLVSVFVMQAFNRVLTVISQNGINGMIIELAVWNILLICSE